ncbi:MAG: CHAP domain-containing protein [Oscillospiraceae bacterium]|nr:CHAP domain-containing protein [Oscillospiraceae bacterium]
MKLSKRILSLFISICMCFSTVAQTVPAYAEDGAGSAEDDTPVLLLDGENEDEEPGNEEPEEEKEPESEDYAAGIPFEELTGELAADLVRIARSQLGCAEDGEDAAVGEAGALHARSRYGAWYGEPYAEWNAIFVLYCLTYADYATDTLPFNKDGALWLVSFYDRELVTEWGEARPQPGDLVFTETGDGGVRVGIVCALEETEDGLAAVLIEGDCEGEVAERSCLLDGGEPIALVRLEQTPSEGESGEEPGEEPGERSQALTDLIAALPLDALTGDWASDALLIAYSQLGCVESATDVIVDDEGETKGYTCYGEYFGQPYGDWCAMFISFCLEFAGVPAERFPRSSGVNPWMDALKEQGLYREAGAYAPAVGDLVFFSDPADRTGLLGGHVGLVSAVETAEGSVVWIDVIQGNTDDQVCVLSYESADATILGYGTLAAAQENRRAAADVYTDESKTERIKDGVAVELFGRLPEGARAEAFPASIDADEGVRIFSAWDISLLDAEGGSVQPEGGSVLVTVRTPEAAAALASGEELVIYHVHDGEKKLLDRPPQVTETGFSFETDGFSVFALGTAPFTGDFIHISSFDQLLLIGTDAAVTDTDGIEGELGLGAPVLGAAGETLRYTKDAHYRLDNDVRFPDGKVWALPEGFTGSFTGPEEADGTRLYDPASDTLYIQNQYQLAVLSAADREESPVTTGDASASGFGMGQFLYPEGEASGKALCYGEAHHYCLSAAFRIDRSAKPLSLTKRALTRAATGPADWVDGRDYFGQTSVVIDGTTYILIGDRQQLDAINSDATVRTNVCTPVYRATEGAVEVYRYGSAGLGDWIWLSEFDGSKTLRDGNGYGTTAAEVLASYQSLASGGELIYPGDADLVRVDASHDFSESPLFDVDSSGYHRLDRPGGTATNSGSSRNVYYTTNVSTGQPDITTATLVASDPTDGTLKYEKDGHYIVFRDIDMTVGALNGLNWKPLMFCGEMIGAKTADSTDVSTLWDAGKTTVNVDVSNKPVISNITVTPILDNGKLNLQIQTGVGFFGTLYGEFSDSTYSSNAVIVRNIKLQNIVVTNQASDSMVPQTLLSGLLAGLGAVLGLTLDALLDLILGKVNATDLQGTLSSLLNARAKDPTMLATGAFAGRIQGRAFVEDCEVENAQVNTVLTRFEGEGLTETVGGILVTKHLIVGKGGFVGYVEGETQYEGLSTVLGGLTTVLSGVLNIIPGIGLGDLITILLGNALDVSKLIPTGYVKPYITSCTANNVELSTEDGKYGVGGFVGSMAGTEIIDCSVINSDDLTVNAEVFGGGFCGIERDAIILTTLSGLRIDVLSALHPQSELIRCSINDSTVLVEGGSYLGGFVGAMANSYAFNDTVDAETTLTVSGTGDNVGGFCGRAELGTALTTSEFLPTNADLLSTVTGLLGALVGQNDKQSLLDIAGVAPSAIMGAQIYGPLTVSSDGCYVGGLLGRGDGAYITSSTEENIRKLAKYDDRENNSSTGAYTVALPIAASEGRNNIVSQLVSVSAGHGEMSSVNEDKSFVGGLAGYLTTANAAGLVNGAVGLGEYMGFTVCDTTIRGASGGYTVTGDENYAGGGIGWAVGGKVYDVELEELYSVAARNNVGGFVGATGPGDLAGGNGLDVRLLGISLISIDNLLSLAQGVRTTYLRANVTGVSDGYTVEETGRRTGSDLSNYEAGGWAALANSVRVVDCHANNLKSVKANFQEGFAGGFVGSSSAGGLAGAVADDANLTALQVGQLVNAVPYLVPSYDGCDVHYVDGGFVEGDTAGGFAGDFQSGKVNTYTTEDKNPITDGTYSAEHAPGYISGIPTEAWSVYNVHHVRGGRYAGGWGGKVYSGALVSAGGGLNVLGGAASAAINADQILGVVKAYIPIVKYAGVNTPSGFSVYAAHDYEDPSAPAVDGAAGGFIGYGSGVQVSFSRVYRLKHGSPTEPTALTADDAAAYSRFGIKPDALESQNGGNYMIFDNDPDEIPYAVAGAIYAGGYIGWMDIGSAASLGKGLKLLGSSLSLTNVLEALSVVVSTIEHSDVEGCPGGFNVVASSHVNLGDGAFDDDGVGYAGGYAGKISGGHIQDGNVKLFYYIIGEIAAGGYCGEAIPGDVAHVLDSASLSLLGTVNNLASLVEDFVPTIRNSETTCVPCGGAVRAESSTSGSIVRGMAGGYIGHCKGAQIWGENNDVWKEENSEPDPITGKMTRGVYVGVKRECAAIRIRSVYGYEYAGGYCGLMECGSTAQTGGLDLLQGLISADNLLGVLKAVYPTIKYAAVYGPLQKTDVATWNAWVTYVGSQGPFHPELAALGTVGTQAELDAAIERFIYGTHVVAGRHDFANATNTILSGCAGGFVGSMHSGVIRHARAEKTKLVCAMRAAGGFAGEMQTKGAADFGTVSITSFLPLNLGNLLKLAEVFVPCVSDAGTEAYRQGLTVQATGDKDDPADGRENGVGCAGGYVGGAYGGQFGRENPDTHTIERVWINGLKAVRGTDCIGGFVGKSGAASSLLNADTNQASGGLLQSVLNGLLSTPSDLLSLLDATMGTFKYAEVTPSDDTWGFTVDGAYDNGGVREYASCAGGFGGYLEAAVIGERRNASDTITVTGLRRVEGGLYAGGFFGLADVSAVADVASGGSTVLNLVNLGNTTLLDAFRTYIYYSTVTGVPDGITVTAHYEASAGTMNQYKVLGGAGGFGGGLMNGTVENSTVNRVNHVQAPNYAGGFIGQMGKSGVLNLDQVQVENDSFLGKILGFLGIDPNVDAQLLSIVGSTVTNCRANGFGPGFTVRTTTVQSSAHNGSENEAFLTGSCAAGFVGFADIAQIENSHVTALKTVHSPQVAAGFIGRTSAAYLAEIDVDLTLVNALLTLLEPVIQVLYGLTTIDLISIPGGDLLGLKLLADGNLVWLNLFGLEIGVSLMENDPEYEGSSDSLTIILGSSTIKLPYNRTDGYNSSAPNASINLIEGNRTSVKNCTVTGVDDGYDVFGDGTGQDTDGPGDEFGYAGGFVGYNEMGYFSHDRMWLCDVVRGSEGRIGPFVGHTVPGSRGQAYLEGNDNHYSIYRNRNEAFDHAETAVVTSGGAPEGTSFAARVNDSAGGKDYNRYDVLHYDIIRTYNDLKDAQQAIPGGTYTVALYAWYYPTKAVLMLNTAQNENEESEALPPDEMKDPCATTFDLNVHKKWRDYNNMFSTRPAALEIEVHVIDVGAAPPGEIAPKNQLVLAEYPESAWQEVDFDDLEAQIPGFKAKFGDENPIVLTLTENPDSTVHWDGRLEGLPVAYKATELIDDGHGNLVPTPVTHYLQYVVVERIPTGYKLLRYEINESTASVVILNELESVVLPSTGYDWRPLYLLAGLPLLLAGMSLFCIFNRKKRRGEVQNE